MLRTDGGPGGGARCQDIWFEILKKIGLDADSCLLQSALEEGLIEAGMNLYNAHEIANHFSDTECIPLEGALDVCKTYRVPGKFRMAMTLKEQFSHSSSNEAMFRASVKKMFDSMDVDGGGTIDQQEMIAGLAKKGLALSAASADDLMRSVDADGSGQIDFEEVSNFVCAGVKRGLVSRDGSDGYHGTGYEYPVGLWVCRSL